jgi:hypothetical protein
MTPTVVLFVSRLALHLNLIRLRTGPSAFACLGVYRPALKCLIKAFQIRYRKLHLLESDVNLCSDIPSQVRNCV